MHEMPRVPDDARQFVDAAMTSKPDLIVHGSDLPETARALRDLFAACGRLFDRDSPVKLIQPARGGPIVAVPLTLNGVVIEAHRLCQPAKIDAEGKRQPVTLPERVAKMYLDLVGEWNLPPLNGISTGPLLADDGSIRSAIGYDTATGLWCCQVPRLSLAKRPKDGDAAAALYRLRDAFKTFPFADSARKHDPVHGLKLVDLDHAPGRDESSFLAALLTAICRASLWLAPGFLVVAPQVSGAGSGKGLLVRALCAIAFGIPPRAFTAGHDRQELDKRIVAELIEAAPALFLDNVNGSVLRSETLASVLTERPARVRVLGQTRMVALNSTAFLVITGNGVDVAEDLARRFNLCELDARCENPEARAFAPGFLAEIEQRRGELLEAALTIWRWGRQNSGRLHRGRPLGSFETWCEWVRDPLLSLGCCDPVDRIEMLKARDPHRQQVGELFRAWDRHHGSAPTKASELAVPIQRMIDLQSRGRQYVAAQLGNLAGTRAAGFVLARQEAIGAWGAATYSLRQAERETDDGIGHRVHRDHRAPMPPMPPMPSEVETADASFVEEVVWTG